MIVDAGYVHFCSILLLNMSFFQTSAWQSFSLIVACSWAKSILTLQHTSGHGDRLLYEKHVRGLI